MTPPPATTTAPTTAMAVASGGLWSLSAAVVTLIGSLVATPFVLRGLGEEAYGVFSIIQVVVGYFAIADFGMGDASTRFSSEAYARNDPQGEARAVWTSLLVQAGPTVLAVLALTIGAGWISRDVLRLPVEVQAAAVAAFPVAALALVGKNVATVFNSPQVVRMQFRGLAAINVVCGLTQIVAVPVVVWRGGSLAECVAVIAATNLLGLVIHFLRAVTLLPSLRLPRFDLQLARDLAAYGGWTAIVTLVTTILMQSEKVLITRFASPTAMAHYAVAFSLGGLLMMVPRAIKGALFPVIARMQTDPSRESMTALYGQITRNALIGMAPVAVAMCLFAAPFFHVWAGPEYGVHSATPFYVLSVGFLATGIASIPVVVLKGLGRVDVVARISMIQVVPFVGAAAWLTWELGAAGGALAFSLRAIADAAMHFAATRKLVEGRIWETPGQIVRFGVAVTILVSPIPVLAVPSVGLALRAALAVAAIGTYAVVTWKWVLTSSERDAMSTAVRRRST